MIKRLTTSILAGFMLFNLSEGTFAAMTEADIDSAIIINENIFSDDAFRSWILDKNNLGGIGEDGILTYDERMSVKNIDVSGQNILNLQGIEVFTNLEELDCSRNLLTVLDLSENTLLKTLNCSYNQISELLLDNQMDLTSLSCNYNRLTYLDVSNKPNLRALSCEYNYIEQLDISGDTGLEWINVRTNLLTGLDTADNVNLKVIEAFDNRLENIGTETLVNLEFLNVSSNRLKELNLSNNTNLSAAGSGFAASNNLLEKIILPNKPVLNIDISSFEEQDPVTGYDRVKWFENEDYSLEVTDSVQAQGQTLYSKRIPNDYKVYFTANGGNGSMQPQSAVYGEEFALSGNTFTRTGYTFEGWNTLPKGNGDSYSDNENVINLSGKSNGGRITLYAQWQPIEYEIQFDANSDDAQGSMESQSAVYNSDLTLPECGFTVSGKEFAGWAQSPDSSVRYSQGANVKNLASSQGEKAVLYAVWKTPVEELQKPYLTELEQNFNSYSSSDYTSEDWDLISSIYNNAEAQILAEDDTDSMRLYCDNAYEEMSSVMTKNERIEEIVQQWSLTHNDVIQNVNSNILNEDNHQLEFDKAEAAINEMTAEELEKYSSLSNKDAAEKTAEDALQEINVHFEDLAAYASASKWISNLNDTSKRPLNQVRTNNFEEYQAFNTQYNQLPEKEKMQIDEGVSSRLKERFNLSAQKLSAVSELKGVYYSIDQTSYTDISREKLLNALSDGIEKIEQNESEDAIYKGLAESKLDILSVAANEEGPSLPDNGDSDDEPELDDNDKPETDDNDKPGTDDNDTPGTDDNDKPESDDNDTPGTDDNDKPESDGNDEPEAGDNDNDAGEGGNNGGSNSGSSSGSSSGGSSGGSSGSSSGSGSSGGGNSGGSSSGGSGSSGNSNNSSNNSGNNSSENAENSGYNVSIADTANGTIDLNTSDTESGTVVSITVTPDEGYSLKSLNVVDDNNNIIALTADENGSYTFIMPDSEVTVHAEFVRNYNNSFKDVEKDSWYYDAVCYVSENGLFNGVSDDTFGADDDMLRSMIMAVLYRAAGEPDVEGEIGFIDVEEGMWYTNPIKWAKQHGITSGEDDLTFAPDKNVTREQLVSMLYRYAEKPEVIGDLQGYSDVNHIDEYALDAFAWAVNNGIINGMNDGTLNPKGLATRAQTAQMLMKFLENIK